MRIAQVAPLYESVPPKLYGGAERIVHALTEELVHRGHDVTLFATGDSQTSANLVAMAEAGIRLNGHPFPTETHMRMLDTVYAQADQFDIIHSHVGHLIYPWAAASATPTVHTLHGPLDKPDHKHKLAQFPNLRYASISWSQRDPVRHLALNWCGMVYNGVRLQHFPYRSRPDNEPYLAFIGRACAEKGPDKAIEIARRAGMRLKVAAKIDPILDLAWAREHFLPLTSAPGVEYLGEIGERDKTELLARASAVLFPIDWPEPFGLVMAEAMACGTPVVALAGGAVEEVLVDGVTGFVCHSIDEMVEAIPQIGHLDRAACRQRAETFFSAEAMASGYEVAYGRAIAGIGEAGMPDSGLSKASGGADPAAITETELAGATDAVPASGE